MTQALLSVEEPARQTFHTRDRHSSRPCAGSPSTLGRERLGIVGESGSGKSQTGRAILGLTRRRRVTANRIDLRGKDLTDGCRSRRAADCAAADISMVLQDPKYSLNPVHDDRRQIVEAYASHQEIGTRDAKERSLSMLEAVQIRDPGRVFTISTRTRSRAAWASAR
jgi:peptide/nickel transport system ATP-binding protein